MTADPSVTAETDRLVLRLTYRPCGNVAFAKNWAYLRPDRRKAVECSKFADVATIVQYQSYDTSQPATKLDWKFFWNIRRYLESRYGRSARLSELIFELSQQFHRLYGGHVLKVGGFQHADDARGWVGEKLHLLSRSPGRGAQ